MIELDNIYNEDCLDTMEKMPVSFLDFVITSPPYDEIRNYNGYQFNFKPIARELFRVLKEGGIIIWVVADATINGSETGTSFKQALYFKEIGFNIHDTMIYYKNNPMPQTGNRYHQHFEYMFAFSKGSPKTFNPLTEPTKYHGLANMKNRGKMDTDEYYYKKCDCDIESWEEIVVQQDDNYGYRNVIYFHCCDCDIDFAVIDFETEAILYLEDYNGA
jgi:DNA modification methylase